MRLQRSRILASDIPPARRLFISSSRLSDHGIGEAEAKTRLIERVKATWLRLQRCMPTTQSYPIDN